MPSPIPGEQGRSPHQEIESLKGSGIFMSPALKILENEVQIAALLFMGAVYIVRLIWLFRFKYRQERTFAEGSEKAGMVYSLLNVAMPWGMESTRKKPGFYIQFVIFHAGVAAAIAATFIIPYFPQIFEVKVMVYLFQILIGAACLVGLMRLNRRLTNPSIRFISTPDDYLSLILMIFFFAAGVLAVPNNYRRAEWPLILFFGLTAFFLVYVPFSKICHYLYYPFNRIFLGKTLGHRGVLPPRKKTSSDGPAS
jgi:nitrate reductase gamma subunit